MTTKHLHLPMVCVCSPEGMGEADDTMTLVTDLLSEGSVELGPYKVAPSNFLTAVVVSLNWDFQAGIDWIGNDQWCGVGASSKDVSVRVECDRVEDGIAAVWLAFYRLSRGEPVITV